MDIVEFGPVRAIGLSSVGSPDSIDFSGLWQKIDAREGELGRPTPFRCFGICRCSAVGEQGAFEYVAAFESLPDLPVPPGMTEVVLPAASYARLSVQGLQGIGKAWEQIASDVATLSDWVPYCGPDGCGCATAPSFELYPPGFEPHGELWIFVPLKRKGL